MPAMGRPNCLLHNEGNATFVDKTEAAGLNAENDRYSFSCAWGDSNSNGLPDLYVANDFGSSQLYRNNGDGTFTVASRAAHVEDVGAGMGCAGRTTTTTAIRMFTFQACGKPRASECRRRSNFTRTRRKTFALSIGATRAAMRSIATRAMAHSRTLATQAGVEMGRWSWSSDFWDFDHDGYPDLYVANGYISAPNRDDLASFFWRQVVAKSSEDAKPSLAYEHGWNAINELIRSDSTWHGYERNVMFANNRDGTFAEVSGLRGWVFSKTAAPLC